MLVRHLQTFVAIVETGSFHAAAAKMNITQSAVSMQIKNLESHLKTELFERSVRPPRLSNAGALVLNNARQIVSLYGEMMRATRVTSQLTGSMYIGTVPGASFLLPVSIKILIKTYRQLKLRVTSNLKYELTDKIKNGKLDIALLTVDGEVDQDLIVRHILTEPLVVLAPLEQYGKSDVELLSQNSYISFNRKASVSGMIEAELQRLKLEVDVVMELDTIETLHTMILEGLGVCILPLSAVRPYLKNKLYMVPFSPTRVRRTIGLVQKKNHHRQALLDKVYDVVANSAKKYESMTPLKISDR